MGRFHVSEKGFKFKFIIFDAVFYIISIYQRAYILKKVKSFSAYALGYLLFIIF